MQIMTTSETFWMLVRAVPLWLLIAFLFVVVQCIRKKFRSRLYFRLGLVLAFINLLFSGIHYTALFRSSSFRGVVVDLQTPLANVRVWIGWNKSPRSPVRLPWWMTLLDSVSLPCKPSLYEMRTNERGEFASEGWHGPRAWQGCMAGTFGTEYPGYRYDHQDRFGRSVSFPVYEYARIELRKE
jgi:hypothetical protein